MSEAGDMPHVNRRAQRWAAAVLLPMVASACLPPAAEELDGTACQTTSEFFAQTVWPRVIVRCTACHVPGGPAAGTRLLLRPADAPAALERAREALFEARTLTEGGRPLLLLKPTGALPHGGGQVIQPGSPEEALLAELLERYQQPVRCDGEPASPPADPVQGVELLGPWQTLRKASLQLAGRLPTPEEVAAVERGGLAALDTILLHMMDEPAFYERLREIFNDVLLTDANLFWRAYDSVISKTLAGRAPGWRWYGSPDTDQGRLTVDAIAREPLEFFVHVARQGRPATEVLTGRYRLVNPYSARVFGLRPAFRDPADPSEFVEVQVPAIHDYAPGQGEYAGVLTTTSFLFRYPNTETNRNRKRARYLLQYFLGQDLMQAAQRLDLSTIDFTDHPWRTNPACTGCHATLDPIAGAFQNWTNCYSGQGIRYYLPGERHCQGAWYPHTTMFPPGTGPGSESTLSSAQLPRALEVTAQAVARNPGFARAMAGHLLRGLLGRPLLLAPADPRAADYAALSMAYDAQQRLLGELATEFARSNFNLKRLILAIVKSVPFRAANADRHGRLELSGLGGGVWTPPEVLHRKIASVMGYPWGTAGSLNHRSTVGSPFHLLAFDRLRILYGGIDSAEVTNRQTLPGGLAAAASQRMAFEMSCRFVPIDLALPRSARRLFPHVERNQEPTGEVARDGAIVRNLQHLFERLLGERLAPTDPALLDGYALFVAAQREGAEAVATGRAPVLLPAACRALHNYATGQVVAGGFADDPRYVVRAWQAVVAYLLLDYRFLFE
ncbi:MAG: hypothetical protein RMK29_07080 [Myxococcales bacterium]|nr:DUF1588 domain-containing protein [Myxococcota bacterium]MDW8281457.1 hypothetical protein [Myxococcales bacterium]